MAIGPVVPAGYQVTGMLGPAPGAPVMPTREQLQANIAGRLGTPAAAPTMRTAAELQADINARTGTTGPQYGGAGLGAVNPVVPEGMIQQGNRYISPGALQAQQAQLAAVDPTIVAQQNKIASSGLPQWQQNIAQQQLRDSLAQSGTPGFNTTAADSATWQARQDDTNARMGYTPEQVAALRAQAQQKETPGKGMYNPASLAQLNPYDPKTQYIRNLANTKGVRNAEYMNARRQAEEKYYRDRNAAMSRAQAGPGFSLGNLAQAFNPFKGVTAIVEGKGKPGDYLDLAKSIYGFF